MKEPRNTTKVIGKSIRLLSVSSLGAFVGSVLTEGFVLVPYWRSLSPGAFFEWYAANDWRLLNFFGSLGKMALAAFLREHSGVGVRYGDRLARKVIESSS